MKTATIETVSSGPVDIADLESRIDSVLLDRSQLIVERRKLYDEVQQLNTLVNQWKQLAEGWESLYRRSRQ